MALPPKVCPECGEEYVHSMVTCVDCEVELVHSDALGDEPASELPPVAELTSIRVASAGWAVALSELLVEAGIPHRVELVSADGGASGPYGVYVRAENVERARAIDAELIDREIPDLPEGWEAAATAGGEGCPACGSEVGADAVECPDCGLALGAPE